MLTLTAPDHDLLRRFEDGSLANDDFRHIDHLRVAWAQLERDGLDETRRCLPVTLLRFATLKGHAEIFDAALTDAWILAIDAARQAHPGARSFDALLAASPDLLDRSKIKTRS